MIGRSHGIHAEPTTFGFKLLVWVDELRRNRKRLEAARQEIAFGKISGSVGTHANVPPEVEEIACRHLGLRPAAVSNQILQRDRHAHFMSTLALIATSLDKFATEVRNLQRTEIGEVEEPFEEGRHGSSSMPHKRNPSRCERVSGLARVVRNNAGTALENVTLWHERDISHSSSERIILPDSCIALDYILWLFNSIVAGLRVNEERMAANIGATHGLIFSQGVLLALIEAGMSRQEAYGLVQGHATRAFEQGALCRIRWRPTGWLRQDWGPKNSERYLIPPAICGGLTRHLYVWVSIRREINERGGSRNVRIPNPGIEPWNRGKVRDIYELGDELLIVATDRVSAYDSIIPSPIPGKGRVLTKLSEFWFGLLGDVIPNHLITTDVHAMELRPGPIWGSWQGGRCWCAGRNRCRSNAWRVGTWPVRAGRTTR